MPELRDLIVLVMLHAAAQDSKFWGAVADRPQETCTSLYNFADELLKARQRE